MAPAGRWADGELVGFDLETTGVDPFSDTMVSFAVAAYSDGTRGHADHAVVNPGRPISPEAQAVHGITDEQAARGMPLDEALEVIVARLVDASERSAPVVGMNLVFDLTIIDSELRRRGASGLARRGWSGPAIDVLVVDRHVDQWRKGRRNLGALCAHYGLVQHDAHDALGDVGSAVAVARAIADRYPQVATMSVSALHDAQIGWHRQWACGFAHYQRSKGLASPDHRLSTWPIGEPLGANRADSLAVQQGLPGWWWCEPCHVVWQTAGKRADRCIRCGAAMVQIDDPGRLPADAGRHMHPEWARAICRHCGERCVVLDGYDGHPLCDPDAMRPLLP